MTNAANGVPVVEIAPANRAGLSHNKFTDFNVPQGGLILNNSAGVGVSNLGGGLVGNRNFAGRAANEASKILNEVTGANPSALLGYLEVHGRQAAVVIANPNGITCDGCGFINTDRASLTTGTPMVDGAGNLTGFDVEGGTVAIQGLGLDAAQVDHFDIIARAAELNAAVHANTLNVVAGRNTVNYATLTATAKADDGSAAPLFAIDSTALGGMYAGRIALIGTEKGVGVNLDGPIATSAADLVITSAGGLALKGEVATAGAARLAAEGAATVEAGLVAVSAVDLDIDGALTVTDDGKITAGGDLEIAAGSATLAGEIEGAQSVEIVTQGDLTNTGTVRADGAATVAALGVLRNDGTMQLRADSTVSGDAGIIQGSAGSLAAAQDLTVTSQGTFSNAGRVSVDGDLTLTGGSLSNSGVFRIGGDLIGRELTDLTNADLIFADGAVDFELSGTLTNTGSLLATDAIRLVGIDGGRMARLLNSSGAIESQAGDIALAATSVRNERTDFSVGGTWTLWRSFTQRVPNPGCYNASPEACARMHSILVKTEHPFIEGPAGYAYYNGFAHRIDVYIFEPDLDALSAPGLISAGGNLSIDGGTIENNHSNIRAVGDIALTGDTLTNTGTQIYSRVDHVGHYSGNSSLRCFGVCVWMGNAGGIGNRGTVSRALALDARSFIVAGGNVTGDFTNRINNTTIVQHSGNTAGTHGGQIDRLRDQAAEVPTGEVDILAALAGTLNAPTDWLDGTTEDEADSIDSFERALGQLIGGFGSQFVRGPEDGPVFETRPELADLGLFLGGEYFLDRTLGDAPSSLRTRLLGDGYLETKLVTTAIQAATGRRFLSDSVTSDADQMRVLLDNAVAAKESLDLSVGVELTPEQVAKLTHPIVWYVTEEIGGESVLVPRLYLTSDPSLLFAPEGALIAGDGDVTLEAETLALSGTVQSGGDLALTADTDIAIQGGAVQSGGDLALSAGRDIYAAADVYRFTGLPGNYDDVLGNLARLASGGDTSLVAGRDIALVATEVSAGGDAALVAGRDVAIVSQALDSRTDYDNGGFTHDASRRSQIASDVRAGGDLSVTAGGNVAVVGSDLAAETGDLALAAGGAVTVAAAEQHFASRTTETTSSKSNEFDRSEVTHRRSNLSAAGGDVRVVAGTGDVTLAATTVAAEGEVQLAALNGDVVLESRTDSAYERELRTGSNAVVVTSLDRGRYDETVQMVEILAGGGVDIQAANRIVADVRVPEGASLDEAIDHLSGQPQFAWMAALRDDPSVDWQAVAEAHESWHERSQGLTPAASAVLMLATTAVLSGTPLGGLFQSVAGSLATTAAGTTNAALAAAVNAGLTALTSQAVHAVAANGGDLGAALDQLGSSGTLRALATAMATAGLLTGVGEVAGVDPGAFRDVTAELADRLRSAALDVSVRTAVDSVVAGVPLDEALLDNLTDMAVAGVGANLAFEIGEARRNGDLNYLTHKLAHAALGGGLGAVRGDPLAGAIGGGVGEIVAEAYLASVLSHRLSDPDAILTAYREDPAALQREIATLNALGVDIAQLSTALVALAADLDADVAAGAAGNAAENNALCGGLCIGGLVLAAAYLTAVGNGSLPDGIGTVGRSEDPLSQMASAALAYGVEQAYVVAPQSTVATLEALAAAGEAADAVVNVVDAATGRVVSRAWNELDQETRDRIVGGTIVATVIVPGTAVAKLTGKVADFNAGRLPVANPTERQLASARDFGVDPRWVGADGRIDWPPNNGFDGAPQSVTLQPGTRIDRYGSPQGGYLSPAGTPFEQRALPPSSASSPHTTYEVVRPLPVDSGPAAPWFGQPGGGVQYQLQGVNVQQMIDDGYLRVVK